MLAQAEARQVAQLTQGRGKRDVGASVLAALDHAVDGATSNARERLPSRGGGHPPGIQVLEDLGGVRIGKQLVVHNELAH